MSEVLRKEIEELEQLKSSCKKYKKLIKKYKNSVWILKEKHDKMIRELELIDYESTKLVNSIFKEIKSKIKNKNL